MKKPLLVFDLDGTLIDSRADLTAAVNVVRDHYHLAPLSLEQVSACIGGGMQNLVSLTLQGFDVDIEEAVSLFRAYYTKHNCRYTTLYTGVYEGLELLKNKRFISVVLTNKPGELSRHILSELKIAPFFSAVIGGGDGYPLKPDPGGLHALIKQFAYPKHKVWMIGDHQPDMAVGRAAGVSTGWVSYGIGQPGELKPTKNFASFSEVVGYFL
jgi:phosphoglycolate phosphatase